MKCKTMPFTQINREYKISSGELKKALNLKGEILGVDLWCGRSLQQMEDGVSANNDEWMIRTVEKSEAIDDENNISLQ